jgi:hypothetical protein
MLAAVFAILELWTIYILAKYATRLKRDLDRAQKSQAFYYQKYTEAQGKLSTHDQVRAKHELYRRAQNAEGALQLAETDLQTSHEHLKYYIEYAADLEKLIVQKDIEISAREQPRAVNEPLLEAIRLQRDVIINKCKQTRALEQQLVAAQAQLASYSEPQASPMLKADE